jgi:hypothetical protein
MQRWMAGVLAVCWWGLIVFWALYRPIGDRAYFVSTMFIALAWVVLFVVLNGWAREEALARKARA